MKNHIIIKFLAIFLCAVSLLGAVSGGLGIFVMTELGLYQRTVAEVYAERVGNYADTIAGEIAVRYASMNLGNCSRELADAYYGTNWYYSNLDWDKLGYVLTDMEGNILQEQPLEEAAEYSFTVSIGDDWWYLNLLDTMTEDEYNAAHMSPPSEPAEEQGTTGFNYVPMEGAEIFHIRVTFNDGDTQNIRTGEPLGILYYSAENQLSFQSHSEISGLNLYFRDGFQRKAVRIECMDESGEILLCVEDAGSVFNEYQYREGVLRFTLMPLEGTEDKPILYDAIPPEGLRVSRVHVVYADGFEESAGASPEIGFLGYDADGFVTFTTDPGVLTDNENPVTYIAFYAGDALIYEASDPGGVGSFENDQSLFRAGNAVVQSHTDDLYVYNDVPPQGCEVYSADIWLKGETGPLNVPHDAGRLGVAVRGEDGNVTFHADDWQNFVFSKPAEVVYIRLFGEHDRLLYERYAAGYDIGQGGTVGIFGYDGGGYLVFSTAPDAALSLAAETVPEATEASVETTPAAAENVTVPVQNTEEPAVSETLAETTAPAAQDSTVPTQPGAYARDSGREYYNYYDSQEGTWMMAEYTTEQMPAYRVEISMADNAIGYGWEWLLLEMLFGQRDYLFPVLGICLLSFAILAAYLCCAAGRKPRCEEVRAGGLNRLPLDLYLGFGILAEVGLLWVCVEGMSYLTEREPFVGLGFGALIIFVMCLVFVAFGFACAAQFKTPEGYWWRNSLCAWSVNLLGLVFGWLLKLSIRLTRVCETKLWPLLVRCCKGLWKLLAVCCQLTGRAITWLLRVLQRGGDRLWNALSRFFSMLPLTWQWLLVGFVLVVWLFMAVAGRFEGMMVLWVFAALAVVFYGAHCFGTLLDAAKRMSKGDLEEKVDDKLLTGGFKDFANELNSLADVAVVAAQKQLKSERMKTELITNVSHDIKTPLTSIINYVDLLQKPHTEPEQAQYLEVLDRQSQRLKKLVDDLMEMSKASTGNLAVDIRKVDAAEAVNQALGEFADKLEKARLIPVFRQPDRPVEMMADGRLVWRVMSNLLGNAVKYALPGTRVYLDLAEVEGKVILSIKNISREELNVNADELLERFVRGDVSRNTEGSGLGLNIAQSLMQLQKGQLQILVDGDLFKVTLIFPGVEP